MAANVPSLALYFMPPAPKPPSGVPVVAVHLQFVEVVESLA